MGWSVLSCYLDNLCNSERLFLYLFWLRWWSLITGIVILLSLYANSETRKWSFIIHMSSHRHMRSSHSRLKLGKVLSRNWNWRCGDNFVKITVIWNCNVPCNYALISYNVILLILCGIMRNIRKYAFLCKFYDKMRLPTCLHVRNLTKSAILCKLLKCVKSHWPH